MITSFNRAASAIALLAALFICAMGVASGEGKAEITQSAVKASQNAESAYYTVKKGDTLWGIAEATGHSLQTILKANRICETVIYPGQELLIPGRGPDFQMALSRGFSREDVVTLARAIYAEARGETFTGQVAVGAVIINRIKSGQFPHSVREVVMQSRSGTYQFTPVQDGSINLDPDDTALYAALQAIAGEDPTNGALYFYNPNTATDKWIKSLPVVARIGNHVFASEM